MRWQLGIVIVVVALLGADVVGAQRAPDIATPDSAQAPQRQAPKAFSLELHWGPSGARNILDTAQGTYTYDMVVDPDSTIQLRLTAAERDSLCRLIEAGGLFDYPEPHPPLPAYPSGAHWPSSDFVLIIREGQRTKTFRWNDHYDYDSRDPRWDQLDRVVTTVIQMVVAHQEYKALPAPRGLYQ